jgi:hypothetical protein
MRIGVLTSEQDPTCTPEHFISKSLAAKFREYRHNGKLAVEQITPGLLWIRVQLTFGKLKALLKPPRGKELVPQILPPRVPDWHFTAYPIKDQTTA